MIKNVHFLIPPELQIGLEYGQLERIGGVVRDVNTKQVVYWLREMPGSSDTSILEALGHQTASLSRMGMIVNIALTATSIGIIMQRLDSFSWQIEELERELKAEFDNDRDAEFHSALRTAEMILASENLETKREGAVNAIQSLYKSFHYYASALGKNAKDKPDEAQFALIKAIQAATSCGRCYLEINELESARKTLSDDIATLEPYVQQLVTTLMGHHPAIYFHSEISLDDIRRFITIQKWLNPRGLLEMLDDVRSDFWNMSLVQDEFWIRVNPLLRPTKNKFDQLRENLLFAEIIIENFQRLQSYEMEVRFLRLTGQSLREWDLKLEQYQSEADESATFAVLELEEPVDIS